MDHIDIPELVGGNGSSLYRYCCRGALWSTLQETGKCMENGKKKQVYDHLQFMFHLLKDFPCQWSMKSSVNSIQFITELNPPRKCRANVHCTDLELKWSAAIANIHCTTHLFPWQYLLQIHYLLYLLHKAVAHWASLSALFLHQVDIANLLRSSLKIKVTPEHS